MAVAPRRLPQGTEITCPECKALIAVVSDDIVEGEALDVRRFDLKQYGHANGKGMSCTDCGSKFCGYFIHTSEGWK